jgi:molybdate transport system substrate-binding protein
VRRAVGLQHRPGAGLVKGARWAAALLATAAACGDTTGGADGTRTSKDGIIVFAASSLTEAFGEIGKRFESTRPGTRVTFSFGASPVVAGQVRAGAPADVIATADERPVGELVDEGLAQRPRAFARNHLAILVALGNPLGVRTLADLARPRLVVVLCAVEVPCGMLAQRALRRAQVTVEPRSFEPDVKAAASRVILGEADAAVVYATEVRAAEGRADGVPLAASGDTSTTYVAARLERSTRPGVAEAFVGFVLSPAGQRVLHDNGFDTP